MLTAPQQPLQQSAIPEDTEDDVLAASGAQAAAQAQQAGDDAEDAEQIATEGTLADAHQQPTPGLALHYQQRQQPAHLQHSPVAAAPISAPEVSSQLPAALDQPQPSAPEGAANALQSAVQQAGGGADARPKHASKQSPARELVQIQADATMVQSVSQTQLAELELTPLQQLLKLCGQSVSGT